MADSVIYLGQLGVPGDMPLPIKVHDNGDGTYSLVDYLGADALTIGDVQLIAGSAIVGKVGIDQTTPGTTNGVQMNAVSACQLAYQGEPRTSCTCTAANTDYVFGANIPAGTTYVVLYAANHFQVSVGEATSSTLGADMTAGLAQPWPLKAADVTAGKALHVQSDTAGTVVYATYLTV